jgi:hypothetical protein
VRAVLKEHEAMAKHGEEKTVKLTPSVFRKYLQHYLVDSYPDADTYGKFVARYPKITRVKLQFNEDDNVWENFDLVDQVDRANRRAGRSGGPSMTYAEEMQQRRQKAAEKSAASARETKLSEDGISLTNLAIVAAGVGALWWFARR